MRQVSVSRDYIPKTFEQGAIFNSIRTIFEVNKVNFDEIRINSEYRYDDGIRENKVLTLEEIKDIKCIDQQLCHLYFYTYNLTITFCEMFDKLHIHISSDDVETIKSTLDTLEKQLSLQRIERQSKVESIDEINDDLIKELVKDGERLINKDDAKLDAPITVRRKAMSTKIKPQLKPQPINCEIYDEYTPEKLELWDGYLIGDKKQAKKLLLVLLYNIGLEETVKLVPKELWEQAINTLHE